jgi:hypothetical protein
MGHSSGVPEVPKRKRKSVEFFSLPTRSQFWGSASGNLVRDHELDHRFEKSEIRQNREKNKSNKIRK